MGRKDGVLKIFLKISHQHLRVTFTNELLDDLKNICLGHLHNPSQMQHHVISQKKMKVKDLGSVQIPIFTILGAQTLQSNCLCFNSAAAPNICIIWDELLNGLPLWLSWSRIHLQCGRPGFDHGLGRCPGEGKGYPLQYSGLENSTDCIAHGVTKSRTNRATFTLT